MAEQEPALISTHTRQALVAAKSMNPDNPTPRMIQTERGIGYVFALPVEPF